MGVGFFLNTAGIGFHANVKIAGSSTAVRPGCPETPKDVCRRAQKAVVTVRAAIITNILVSNSSNMPQNDIGNCSGPYSKVVQWSKAHDIPTEAAM